MGKENYAWREIIRLVLGCASWFREIDARGLVDRDQKLKSISSGEMENKEQIELFHNLHLHRTPTQHSKKSISQC